MKYTIVPEIQFDCWGEHFVPRLDELTGDLRSHVTWTLKLTIIRKTELIHMERSCCTHWKNANSYET